jgi:hypothetical protein
VSRIALPNMTPLVTTAAAVSLWLWLLAAAAAQNTPAPGPTNATPPNPRAQPGATIVINPTEQECRRGWDPSLKWTKEQFQGFCTRLGASK